MLGMGRTAYSNESSGECQSSLKVVKFCIIPHFMPKVSPKVCLWGLILYLLQRAQHVFSSQSVPCRRQKSLQLENTSQGT